MGNYLYRSNHSHEGSESEPLSDSPKQKQINGNQFLTSMEENTARAPRATGVSTKDGKRTITENEQKHSLPPSSSSPSSPSPPISCTDMETASVMRDRGLEHVKNKDYAEALGCHRRALALHKQESQEQNEDLANHYDNLGTVYQETNAANRAASYFHKALTIRLNLHGQDHLSTASSFDRIGTAYSEQGDYDKALNFHHKAKHVKKKLLGRDHEETAKSMWNIGDVHYRKKDYNDALIYFGKALDVQGRVLDDDHPDKVATQNSIGLLQEKIVEKASKA